MKNLFVKLLILSVPSIAFAHGISDSDKSEMVQGTLADFFYLGAKHMVTGYDHILFLIGVIFFLTRITDIAKFVTAFTVGHSITLVFATFYEISINYYLIDAVIAISVMYKGFENLDGFNKWFSINAPNKILMVLIFGLIHGFGLSTRLKQIDLGHHQLIYKILSFNGGVEMGQIIALSFAFPLLMLLKKLSGNISKITNWMLIIAGSFLLIFQLNGYFTDNIKPEITHDNHQINSQIEDKLNDDENHHKHDKNEPSHHH